MKQLQYLMRCLRDEAFGCAWDKKQTFKSIAPYTLEEAYEVVDAIEREDFTHLKEELGDLLFQVVFYAQMAEEAQHFTFDDIAAGIVEKMLRRHPHVFPDGDMTRFGEVTSLTEQEISAQWQQIKAQEKNQSDQSLLADVPVSMPALMQAVKLQQKAAKVGFDWPNVAPVFDKIREELDELEAAMREQNASHTEEEMGDVLFAVSNLARHLNISPDVALNKTNIKFRRRFGRIETLVSAQNKKLADCSLEELDHHWEQAKHEGL
jgi:nucleoside triphosphate diphosphatase